MSPDTFRSSTHTAFIGLQCHLCKTMFPALASYVCDRCLGPLGAGLRLQGNQDHHRRNREASAESLAVPGAVADRG